MTLGKETITVTDRFFRVNDGTITRVRSIGETLVSIDEDFPVVFLDNNLSQVRQDTLKTSTEVALLYPDIF